LQDNETSLQAQNICFTSKEPIWKKESISINWKKFENGTGKNIWLKALAADETIANS
jgi:hypothetical protein